MVCNFRFADLSRAEYTTNANDMQPLFISADSGSKQCAGPVPPAGGRWSPGPRRTGAAPPDAGGCQTFPVRFRQKGFRQDVCFCRLVQVLKKRD